MAYETRQASVAGTRQWTENSEPGEGMRLAQGRFLDELPGAVFAVITLIWVVSSFAGLFF